MCIRDSYHLVGVEGCGVDGHRVGGRHQRGRFPGAVELVAAPQLFGD